MRNCWFICVALLLLSGSSPAQDWKVLVRRAPAVNFEPPVLDAHEGFTFRTAPSLQASVIRTVPGPAKVKVSGYFESEGERFYLTDEPFMDLVLDGKAPAEWIHIPGTRRPQFIRESVAAKPMGTDKVDHFKFGEVEAEIYEETVTLAPVTSWGSGFRIAEEDFILPVKVDSFVETGNGGWTAQFTVFPSFESDTSRIPGPDPGYDGPMRALFTYPANRTIELKGESGASTLASVLQPSIVFSGSFSEGRLQKLKVGDVYPNYINTSLISPPHFLREDELSFRFHVARLNAEPVVMEIRPDEIGGTDYTDYNVISQMGPPFSEDYSPEWIQSEWSIELFPDGRIRVSAPLMDGRGAAAMLELEGLNLDQPDTYEQDLQALLRFHTVKPAPLPPATGGWQSILKTKLGPVPASQQIQVP